MLALRRDSDDGGFEGAIHFSCGCSWEVLVKGVVDITQDNEYMAELSSK